jgi:hypothetical protein
VRGLDAAASGPMRGFLRDEISLLIFFLNNPPHKVLKRSADFIRVIRVFREAKPVSKPAKLLGFETTKAGIRKPDSQRLWCNSTELSFRASPANVGETRNPGNWLKIKLPCISRQFRRGMRVAQHCDFARNKITIIPSFHHSSCGAKRS